MPWTAKDAVRHTKKADSPHKQKVWAEVASAALERHGDEGKAVREANSVIKKMTQSPTGHWSGK